MKSFRWTWIAIACVALLAGLTIFDFKRTTKNEEQEEKGRDVLRLSKDALGHIEIHSRTSQTILDKQSGNWKLISPISDSADEQVMQTFMMSLTGEKIAATVVEGDQINLDTYGLKDPVKRLELKTEDGKTEEVRIGSVKAYDGNLYAQIDQDRKVYLVSSNWDPMLSRLDKEYRDKHVLRQDLSSTELKKIEFSSAIAKGDDFQLSQADKHWKISGNALDYPVADLSVANFLGELRGVRASDFAPQVAGTGGAKASYHLDHPRFQVKLFKDAAEPVFAASFSDFSKLDPKATGADATKTQTSFVMSSDVKDVMIVAKTNVESVIKTPQDFYDRKLPFRFAKGDVEKIEVAAEGLLDASFEKMGQNWSLVKLNGGDGKDSKKAAQTAAISGAIEKLSQLEAVRILELIKKGSQPTVLKKSSQITFFNKSGESLFRLQWGSKMTEKATEGRPEAHFMAARTDRVDALIGLPELQVTGLELASWIGDPLAPGATPPPAPSPGAGHRPPPPFAPTIPRSAVRPPPNSQQ